MKGNQIWWLVLLAAAVWFFTRQRSSYREFPMPNGVDWFGRPVYRQGPDPNDPSIIWN